MPGYPRIRKGDAKRQWECPPCPAVRSSCWLITCLFSQSEQTRLCLAVVTVTRAPEDTLGQSNLILWFRRLSWIRSPKPPPLTELPWQLERRGQAHLGHCWCCPQLSHSPELLITQVWMAPRSVCCLYTTPSCSQTDNQILWILFQTHTEAEATLFQNTQNWPTWKIPKVLGALTSRLLWHPLTPPTIPTPKKELCYLWTNIWNIAIVISCFWLKTAFSAEILSLPSRFASKPYHS